MKFKNLMVLSLSSIILLNGCSNKIMDETNKVDQQNSKVEKKPSSTNEKSTKDMEEVYKKYEKPLSESVQEVDADKVQVIKSKEVTQVNGDYKDPVEFAKYAGKILYEFYTLQITPDVYYQFLMNYGSKDVIHSLPSESDSINIFTAIQDNFKKENTNGTDYELTVPVLNRLQNEGHFYRKTTTIQGEEYFQTTIVKENGVWKYVQDGPAPPYTVDTTNSESTNTK